MFQRVEYICQRKNCNFIDCITFTILFFIIYNVINIYHIMKLYYSMKKKRNRTEITIGVLQYFKSGYNYFVEII